MKDRLVIGFAATGLGAVAGAFVAGEMFVRDGRDGRVPGDGAADRGGARVVCQRARPRQGKARLNQDRRKVAYPRSSCSSSALQLDLRMAAAVALSTPPTSTSQTKLSMPAVAAIARVSRSKRDSVSEPWRGASASATHIVAGPAGARPRAAAPADRVRAGAWPASRPRLRGSTGSSSRRRARRVRERRPAGGHRAASRPRVAGTSQRGARAGWGSSDRPSSVTRGPHPPPAPRWALPRPSVAGGSRRRAPRASAPSGDPSSLLKWDVHPVMVLEYHEEATGVPQPGWHSGRGEVKE